MCNVEIFLSVFSSSFIGAISKDLLDVINGNSSNFRAFSIILSCITSFFIVAFGLHSVLPSSDWRFLSFVSFVLSFSGVRIASIFSKNLSFFSDIPFLKNIEKGLKDDEDEDDRRKKNK